MLQLLQRRIKGLCTDPFGHSLKHPNRIGSLTQKNAVIHIIALENGVKKFDVGREKPIYVVK